MRRRGISNPLAIAGALVIVIFVLAGLAYIGSQTTVQTTSAPPATTGPLTIDTTCASGIDNQCSNSSSSYTTSSSSQAAEAGSNSSSGLRLDLHVAASNSSLRSLVIDVDDYNTLNVTKNMSVANDWQYPATYLNPYDSCGSNTLGPVGFAIFQGYYGLGNYTEANALLLFNSTGGTTCTEQLGTNQYYSFSPDSDSASFTDSGTSLYTLSASLALTETGYWEGPWIGGSLATFHSFPQGGYTVLAADEWGNVVLAHFAVSSTGAIIGALPSQ